MTHFLKRCLSSTQTTLRPRFSLLRNFSIVSLGGFLLATGLLATVYRRQAVNDLILSTEENNVILAQILINTIWAEYGAFLSDTQALSAAELTSDSRTQQLHNQIVAEIQGSPIAKVKIFDLQGRTVFSTNTAHIGADKSQAAGFLSAKTGQVFSQLGRRESFQALQGQYLENRHFLSSYSPIQIANAENTTEDEILGVVELYTDVTPLLNRINQTQQHIVLLSLLILGTLYLILFIFMQNADKRLNQQYQQVQASEARYRKQSIELEDRVEARTKELSDTLSQLQVAQGHLIHKEKMSGLGQMVAGVAHEINNPVNFIHGNLKYLEDYSNNIFSFLNLYEKVYPQPSHLIEEQKDELEINFIKEDLEKILSSMRMGTDRIREIVLSLRNFSRKDESAYKSVNIHDGLESTLMILGHRLKATSYRPAIQIVRDFADIPPIGCYPGQLNQVFMNILANAIDAINAECEERKQNIQHLDSQHLDSQHLNEQAVPTITIQTQQSSGSVRISMKDNGPGIPADNKARIFEPFFTTKEVGKGTGMGMAISYQLITEKHQGTLSCQSEEGKGTEFIIEIPTQLDEPEASSSSSLLQTAA
ncbi:MAG: ATP-binding protein [Cyanobacteria bacterium P01_D01_bin.105]